MILVYRNRNCIRSIRSIRNRKFFFGSKRCFSFCQKIVNNSKIKEPTTPTVESSLILIKKYVSIFPCANRTATSSDRSTTNSSPPMSPTYLAVPPDFFGGKFIYFIWIRKTIFLRPFCGNFRITGLKVIISRPDTSSRKIWTIIWMLY